MKREGGRERERVRAQISTDNLGEDAHTIGPGLFTTHPA